VHYVEIISLLLSPKKVGKGWDMSTTCACRDVTWRTKWNLGHSVARLWLEAGHDGHRPL